jgi:hypothetical protein
VEEGSAFFLSTIGCLVGSGTDGLPAPITFTNGAVVVVEKFIFCIGSNCLIFRFYQRMDIGSPPAVLNKK